jgi:hypothetical protein
MKRLIVLLALTGGMLFVCTASASATTTQQQQLIQLRFEQRLLIWDAQVNFRNVGVIQDAAHALVACAEGLIGYAALEQLIRKGGVRAAAMFVLRRVGWIGGVFCVMNVIDEWGK